jgi:hypothetical protein
MNTSNLKHGDRVEVDGSCWPRGKKTTASEMCRVYMSRNSTSTGQIYIIPENNDLIPGCVPDEKVLRKIQ